MTVANIITLGRIALVPLIVWALLSSDYRMAFILFIIAGVSDAIDGIVARFFNQRSELGQILDPLADKLMMLFVFVALSWMGELPVWLVVIVVGRDVGLVAAAAIASLLGNSVTIAPLFISKITTTLQIMLAGLVLFELAFDVHWGWLEQALIWSVAGFTVASGAVYLYLRSRSLLDIDPLQAGPNSLADLGRSELPKPGRSGPVKEVHAGVNANVHGPVKGQKAKS